MDYTLQKELDFLGFGARWGCFACGYINIPEHELGRKLHESEINQIIGSWFRLGLVALCNYKNHDYVTSPKPAPDGWDERANPEWHYWVQSQRATLLVAMEIVGITELAYEYQTVIMDVTAMGGTSHYAVLEVIGGDTINPTPGLVGPVIETRKVVV